MEIVKATATHTAAIAALFNAYRVWYNQPHDPDGALQFIDERLRNNDSIIYAAVENGKMIGFTQLYPLFSSVKMKKGWLLNDLFVHPDHRNLGAGGALLNAARELGVTTGAGWIMLQTDIINTGAQALYERAGFEKDEMCFYYYQYL